MRREEIIANTEAIVREAKALGADEAIANTVIGSYRQIRFSNDRIDIGLSWRDYSTSVMISWRRRVALTEIKDFRDAPGALRRLIGLAKISRENPGYGGVAKGRFEYAGPMADGAIERIEDPSEYIEEAIGAAKREAGEGAETGGILFTKYERVFLCSSEGPEGWDERSAIELSIRAFSQRDASGHGVECSNSLRDFDPARAGRKAGEIAKLAANPRAGRAGVYDVVLDPLFFGSLMGVYGSMGSAFHAMTRMSIFSDKLGERVAPDIVTIRDDPRSCSINCRAFDDEGVPVRETVFIERGILRTFFHNTSTAKAFGTETTGHAGIIVPMPWNLSMDPGDFGRDEMLEELRGGLYLTNTWYTRFHNYATGDFSTIPRDGIFLVEGGEVRESWKGIRVSDNALRILSSISAISKERQRVHWWLEADPPSLSPYVLIEGVRITEPD
jgi:PmbA protein